ncbi:diguanylate cyclase [Vibrio ponticus]|nr:diguanylate cyclase [Vibrio ponticus]
MQSQFSMTWQRPTHFDKHYVLDEQRFVMHIFLPLRNVNGGGVWAVFNAHELADFKATLIRDIALEALLALLLTMGVVYWVAHWIVNPLKNLAKSMTNPVNYRSLEVIPALERNDEIGQLAQAYQGLLLKIAQQLDSLRAKSDADSLTGLGSRYKYTRTAFPYIQRHLSDGKVVALMICDIDNFKAYNDIYGHMQGDKALVQVAAQLEASLTNVDLAYRYGGEEFVVLCWRHNQEEIERVGELLRRAVESLSLIHSGNSDHNKVTVSIGGAMTQLDCKQKSEVNAELLTSELFATADKALYECKAAGRNRTAWANVFSAQLTPIHSARGSK